ncbi:MAG: AAA family ATPase [Mangrovibacterium sp.]
METPFVFGKLATSVDFTDRDAEKERLKSNFNSLTNTILISPRRWGKSSLVQKVANEVSTGNKELRFCFLDVFNMRTEEEFYQQLALEVLKASTSKIENLLSDAGKFLGRFLPKLSFSPDSQNEISLSLDWQEVMKNPDDILNMAEKVAEDKGLKFILCIDEFQNISSFENPLAFQKKLRSQWQKQQHVAYCLYGSKRHMLMEVFTQSSMPFYKFGDLIFLQKISLENWIPFICKRFNDTNKFIDEPSASLIAELAECHPYYVQQLAQQSWLRSDKICKNQIVKEAHEILIAQLSLLFQCKTDELATTQLNFLKALLQGIEQFSSKETLQNYRLGTSANVIKIKKMLESREIIEIHGSKIEMLDPMYKCWLKTNYFKI